MSQLNKTTEYIPQLYTYKPAFKNLYKIEIFDMYSYTDIENRAFNEAMQSYILLHAYQVDLDGESLTLQRNPVTKQFSLAGKGESYKLVSELKITWRESDIWFVKKYHENWLSRFYNRDTDQYISGTEGKARNFLITLPSSSKSDLRLLLTGVYPKDTGGVNLQWGPSGSIVTHSLNYYVTAWRWINHSESEDGLVLGEGASRTEIENLIRGL